MEERRLGRSDLLLPPFVVGGMFRGVGSRDDEIQRTLDRALDLGLVAIDTAPLYDFGGSEALLGRWLATRRNRATLLTKVGLRWDDDWGEILFEVTGSAGRRRVRRDSRPASVRRDVEESLGRLGVDHLDLVQVHHRDRGTPISETLGELARLREEGKLRSIGVSNFTTGEVLEADAALGELPLAATQEEASLLGSRVDLARLATANIGVLAYSPLARGMLAGRGLRVPLPSDDGRRRDPFFQPRNLERVRPAFEGVLLPIAEAHGATPAQVALAWLVAAPGITAAIVGVHSPRQVDAAASALELPLREEERVRLGEAFSELQLERARPRSLGRRVRARLGRALRRMRDG